MLIITKKDKRDPKKYLLTIDCGSYLVSEAALKLGNWLFALFGISSSVSQQFNKDFSGWTMKSYPR